MICSSENLVLFISSVLLSGPDSNPTWRKIRGACQACFAGKHILLVDDADTALDLAEWLLHSKIEKVTICKNGQEALDWMAINAAPNLVLMDIQMPVMNGITAVAKMRSNPDLEKIPVIAITADANKQTIEEARSVGVNNYITKPFKPEKLNDIIKQLLSQIG
jgi:CheY-like chemotaxis protein